MSGGLEPGDPAMSEPASAGTPRSLRSRPRFWLSIGLALIVVLAIALHLPHKPAGGGHPQGSRCGLGACRGRAAAAMWPSTVEGLGNVQAFYTATLAGAGQRCSCSRYSSPRDSW